MTRKLMGIIFVLITFVVTIHNFGMCIEVMHDRKEIETYYLDRLKQKESKGHRLWLSVTGSPSNPLCQSMSPEHKSWICQAATQALNILDLNLEQSSCRPIQFKLGGEIEMKEDVLACPVQIEYEKSYLYLSYDDHSLFSGFKVFVFEEENDNYKLYKHVSGIPLYGLFISFNYEKKIGSSPSTNATTAGTT